MAWLCAPYASPWYFGGSTKNGKTIGASCLIVVGIFITLSSFFGSVFRVLLMPCLGRFVRPFAVAGLGFNYFTTSSWLKLGHPLRNPLHIAFTRDDFVGLHNNLCANFTVLAWLSTEWVNVAIPGNLDFISLLMGNQGISHTGAGLWLGCFGCMCEKIRSWGGL
jgi:hypothetical protein